MPGLVFEYGSATVDATEIMEFGRAYDRQPLHLDAEEAAAGPFGGLIASGWQTAALMMRLFTMNYVSGPASVGGLGVDELRWPRPVRAGDTLRIRLTVLDARVSKSKPDRGVLRTFVEMINQHDEVVLVLTISNLMLLRNFAAAP